MIRDVLHRIGSEYLQAKTEPFAQHPLGRFIRQEGPAQIADALGDRQLEIWGGLGVSGRWSAVPWIGLFDPAASDSAQRGFYLVYLFSADMGHVYLSMNQGTTEVQEELGANEKALEQLRSRAAVMRQKAPGYKQRLGTTEIDLASKLFFPKGYEAGHAFGASYDLAHLPDEAHLLTDLRAALSLYRTLITGGGAEILSDEEAEEVGLTKAPIEEKRRYVAHRKIERNPKAAREAKKHLGAVCQGCAFDFGAIYGNFAEGYIEAHHLIPLADIPEGETVQLDPERDFAVLCANCHRMMHRRNGPGTVQVLRDLLGVRRLRDYLDRDQ